MRRRKRVEPTEEWDQLELLLRWPEQFVFSLLRPVVVFGGSIAERARETGVVSERTLRRKADHFDEYGMPSLFPLDAFGEGGWLKALRLPDYAPREPRRPPVLQEVLFPYLDAL